MDSSESEPEEDSESEPWSFAKKDIAGGLWSIDVETAMYFFVFLAVRWSESLEDNGAPSAISQNAETPRRAPYYLLVALVYSVVVIFDVHSMPIYSCYIYSRNHDVKPV